VTDAKNATAENAADQESESPQSYEQARAELEDVVRRLEAGGVPLEESLALWERGELLAQQCQDWLDGARRTQPTRLRPQRSSSRALVSWRGSPDACCAPR
jgi:exodeoxyribonuclease VII small subunit